MKKKLRILAVRNVSDYDIETLGNNPSDSPLNYKSLDRINKVLQTLKPIDYIDLKIFHHEYDRNNDVVLIYREEDKLAS